VSDSFIDIPLEKLVIEWSRKPSHADTKIYFSYMGNCYCQIFHIVVLWILISTFWKLMLPKRSVSIYHTE